MRAYGLACALELPRGRRRRADPERAELVVLGRAVVGDDAEVGQDRAAAARQLDGFSGVGVGWPLRLGARPRRLGRVGARQAA